MPNSLQSSAIGSPASRRATNCSLSSITEHSFQGITPSPLRGESVTYVSGTMCYLCLRPLTIKQRVFSIRAVGALTGPPLGLPSKCFDLKSAFEPKGREFDPLRARNFSTVLKCEERSCYRGLHR